MNLINTKPKTKLGTILFILGIVILICGSILLIMVHPWWFVILVALIALAGPTIDLVHFICHTDADLNVILFTVLIICGIALFILGFPWWLAALFVIIIPIIIFTMFDLLGLLY